ncbi:MAG: Transcriptional regulatory protein ZraR [Chlamydiae bacterium]|nr:Transcriptional regulatory protein ZraR [Chlamydiota bacterium]
MQKKMIIAESPAMKHLLQNLSKIAASHSSIFISGESGTGKEVIAQAIHSLSPRADAPFIKVNCAAVPDTLIESEFFGHERGAFTGAISRRIGRFESADTGTLLLDEISEIPLTLQPKLLRAVQEQEFERVGGRDPIKVNVRFLSTSNRNMQEAIEQNLFREDLYYRLNVVPIYLLPLRERKEDILPLADYFLANHAIQKTLSEEAKKALLEYSWRGNIRELSNLIERALVMSNNEVITPEDLALNRSIPFSAKKTPTLKQLERRHILHTLKELGNNRTRTAKMLGISIRTLRNKLRDYAKL